jgi:hypothetical protein
VSHRKRTPNVKNKKIASMIKGADLRNSNKQPYSPAGDRRGDRKERK